MYVIQKETYHSGCREPAITYFKDCIVGVEYYTEDIEEALKFRTKETAMWCRVDCVTKHSGENIRYIKIPDLKPGDKVIMNTKYYVSPENRGKVWEVRSDPWTVGGTEVVLLCGRAGGYAVDGLNKIEQEEKT